MRHLQGAAQAAGCRVYGGRGGASADVHGRRRRCRHRLQVYCCWELQRDQRRRVLQLLRHGSGDMLDVPRSRPACSSCGRSIASMTGVLLSAIITPNRAHL